MNKSSKKLKSSRALKKARPGRSSSTYGLGPFPPQIRMREVIERGLPGFAALEYACKLNYYDVATISTGAGSAGTRVYCTNGLYDPDITGTGHQPMPFDQLMLSFEHYVVTRATMTVNFKNTATTTSQSVAISLNAGTTPVTAYATLAENGILVRDRIGQYPYGDSIASLTLPCDVAKFGAVRNLLDNPSYEGTIAANPTESSYFHISVWNPDSVSSTDCLVEIFIVFEAVFREPRKNSPSLNAMMKKFIMAEERKTQ